LHEKGVTLTLLMSGIPDDIVFAGPNT